MQMASTQEKRNTLMRQINKWRELQLTYMPGAVIPPSHTPEDNVEDAETAENVPLVLPSNLDSERRDKICLHQVAEHEQLLRMAQLQDSLIELRHARKIRRKLMLNHYTQVAGQGQRANTRSRTVLNSVENRIAKFVERYRVAYRALLELDPTGGWRATYLELKDDDNRGPGKENDEEGFGDGSYFRSWIWLPNPQVPANTTNGDCGEEGASEDDVNELLRVEWTTSFARLERWNEEVELLQEEMRRVVAFLDWRSQDWLARVEAPRGDLTPDIRSGVNAYAKKQAAVYRNLAASFAKLWYPTLVSHGLNHSWAAEYMTTNGLPVTETAVPAPNVQGTPGPSRGISVVSTVPSVAEVTTRSSLILEEADYSEDSGLEDSDLDSADFWDDDDDLGF